MHGAEWLANPATSIALICGGAALLAASLALAKKRGPANTYNVQWSVAGHKIVDTGDTWLLFTGFLGLVALGSHYLAEYALHLYDVTPVDVFTHSLSGMAVAAIALNFNLTRGRRIYYPTSIAASWLLFVLWEVYEFILVTVDPGTHVQIGSWDTAVDLWVDTLGALTVCFAYDELVHEESHRAGRQKQQL